MPAPAAAKFAYGVAVDKAIRGNLYNPKSYSGKACSLCVSIVPDGLLLALHRPVELTARSGPSAQSAMSAACQERT
ncbi:MULTISPECIES: cell envelope integrity TolA C-terminal domain-containing protein [unclassified Leclercia]|nr:hypothetical protein [Leclercia sp. LTM01]